MPRTDPRTGKPVESRFLAFLDRFRGGLVADEASQALADVSAAVKETGKAGSVTLLVKISPAEKGDHTALRVSATVAVKQPRREMPAQIMFAHPDGTLSQHLPNQAEIAFDPAQSGAQ